MADAIKSLCSASHTGESPCLSLNAMSFTSVLKARVTKRFRLLAHVINGHLEYVRY